MSIDTYYSVLGVGENASQAEIKAAYRELVRQVHPDSVPNASPYWKRAAEEKTKEINEAYGVLSDVTKRREYDRLLAEARQDQEQPQPAVSPASASAPTQQSAPQPQPTASRPKRSLFVRTGNALVLGLFLIFIAAIVFLLVRTMWGAFLSSAIFAAVLWWRKLFTVFPQYRRWCVAALAVSVCFVIADLVYPAEESKPTQGVRTGTPAPGPTPVRLRAQDLEVERPQSNAQHLPNGVFSSDPMDGYGETKTFMGGGCSWDNVDAESKKRWMETGTITNHTFMISPNDETCYVWNQDVDLFVSRGAVRGQPVFRGGRVIGYKRPPIKNLASADRASPKVLASQPLPIEAPKAPAEERPSPASHPSPPSLLSSDERQSMEAACSNAKYLEGPAAYNRCLVRQMQSLNSRR